MATDPSTTRTNFFQELKPRCIAINNLTVRAQDKRAASRELINVTEDLSNLLDRQIHRDASVLDSNLAEYIFFPLSNILRNQREYPIRLTELTIKCIGILLDYGWKSKVSPELSHQLLIFLAVVVGGVPDNQRKDPIPEETKLESLKTLSSLFRATGSSLSAAKSLVEDSAMPDLGHAITVILDATTDGESPAIQLEALGTLQAVFSAIKDRLVLASFLPGTVSALTVLLNPPAALKTSKKVLVKGIAVFHSVLVGVLGDIKIMSFIKQTGQTTGEAQTEGKVLTAPWLKATADQIKLALANVLKLRSHKSEDVQCALERLCLSILDECHNSLATCTSILVESAMILSSEDQNNSLLSSGLKTSLTDLASIYPELAETIKVTVYNWVTSLPRIMQSNDEDIKQQAIRNLLKGQHMMNSLRIDSSTLSDTLTISLRDSVSILIADAKPSSHVSEITSNEIELSRGDLIKTETMSVFKAMLMTQGTQISTRTELMNLIAESAVFSNQTKLARDMLEYVQGDTGNSQIASFWLAFELVKSGLAKNADVDEFLDLSSVGDSTEDHEYVLQELYSFSVSVLNSAEETSAVDWRLQALAVEVTTFTAFRMAVEFRPELIDVLYPIATLLGAENPRLREHAIIGLNSIAASCGYTNVADLIIDNVDYMVNSISLRLNTFDISPASTQVLRMMIKLTGPKLLPFLDDVVASVFAALDNYHGYPLLVENLFSVLAEIAAQGTKSDTLLLEDAKGAAKDHRKLSSQASKIQDISELLESRSHGKRKRQEEGKPEWIEGHPERPWKNGEKSSAGEIAGDEDEPSQEVEKKPPPKTPTYTLLTKITYLTQHYLTSPTPTLRKSLLDLLVTVCPALAPDEEAFLPMVNAIWPVLLARLHDPEPFVVISACKALSALCAGAGDFLSTRFKTEWGDGLGRWCSKAKANAQGSRRMGNTQPHLHSKDTGGPSGLVIPMKLGDELQAKEISSTSLSQSGLGKFTQAAQVWEAVKELLVALVSFVRIDDSIFEQILSILTDSLTSMPKAREALEAVNADAVWLAMYEKRMVNLQPRPILTEVDFVELCL